MSSYLADVKSKLEDVFFDSFDRAWKEVVEPAIKESYRNGLEAGRAEHAEKKPATDAGDGQKPRRRWRTRARAQSGAGSDG